MYVDINHSYMETTLSCNLIEFSISRINLSYFEIQACDMTDRVATL